jgi:rhodanese-related sulfurtransferase
MNLQRFWWWLPFGRVPEIDTYALSALLRDGPAPLILDVRTGHEWQHSHIAGALNIPVTELGASRSRLPADKRSPIVAVCRSARRSIPAVRFLKQRGYTQVCQLQGGMLSWLQAGMPVDGEQEGVKA